jgi:hypothetical protein
MGTGVRAKASLQRDAAPRALGAASASAIPLAGMSATVPAASVPSRRAADWAAAPRRVEEAAVSAAPGEAWRVSRDVMARGWRHNVDLLVFEKTYRFPVLAYWSFTCTGAGSFETLMQGLDVALLGSAPIDPAARPRPECMPAVQGDAPPPTPPPRPDLESAETGHVGLDHLTRRGDAVRAWYRGPFTLHVTERGRPDADGRLPLAHTSDQLRRLVPDGREDLSLAAAFEIGRLLALSQPAIVATLMRWREERFGEARASRLSSLALEGAVRLDVRASVAELGRLVGKQFVIEAARRQEAVLGPTRPPVDPGRPLPYARGDLDQILATGFGLDAAKVRELTARHGLVGALASLSVPQRPADRFEPAALESLKASLDDAVTARTADVLGAERPPGPGGIGPVGPVRPRAAAGTRAPDALDRLLERAGRFTGPAPATPDTEDDG